MTVLISGGSGFVGTAVAEALLARGERVVLFALDTPRPEVRHTLEALPGHLTCETGDVRDVAAFRACLSRHQVDRLLPFAAITSGPRRDAEAPELVFEVNLLGFIAQLQAARDAGVRRVIAPSSGAVYGESYYSDLPLREESTPCVPTGLYGVTKYAVERTALRLGALWGLDVIAARIGGAFGPWERDTGLRDTISPHWWLMQAALAGREAVLPEIIPMTSWLYARDAASALLHLLDLSDPPHRVLNICSGMPWGARILEWCGLLQGAFPGFTWRQSSDPAEVTIPFNDPRRRTSMGIDRLQVTGWTPRFPPEQAYPDYLEWVLRHRAWLRGDV